MIITETQISIQRSSSWAINYALRQLWFLNTLYSTKIAPGPHSVHVLSFYGFFSLDVKVVISVHCYIYAILLLPRALQIVKSLRAWFRVWFEWWADCKDGRLLPRVKRGDAPTCQREIGQPPPTLLSGGIQRGRARGAREVTRWMLGVYWECIRRDAPRGRQRTEDRVSCHHCTMLL